MNLVRLKPIDYTASCFFHTLGPVDIILLVEPCPKLNQHRHILPVLRRRAQILYQPRFFCKTIDGNLDGHHIRVHRSLLNHLEKRVHALIRIVQQDIPLLDLPHHIAFQHMG